MSARTATVASAHHGRLSMQTLFAVALAVAVFAVDTFTPLGSAVAVIYGIVIMLAGAVLYGRKLVLVATACAGLTVFSYLATHGFDVQDSAFLRCVVSLCAIAATTFLVLRNQAASEVLRSQAALLDLSHDAIFVRDQNDAIVYWNRAAEELYGWRASEAMGASAHKLLQTRFPEDLATISAELLRDGRWEGELVHRGRNGTNFVMASRWALQRGEDGKPAAVLETNTDITRRKQADAELRRSEQRYRSIFQTAGVAIWSGDYSRVKSRLDDLRAQGVADIAAFAGQQPAFVPDTLSLIDEIDVNQTAVRMAKARDKPELIRRFQELMAPESIPPFLGLLQALAEGAPAYEAEMPLLTLTGERLSTWMSVTLPTDDGGFDQLLLTLTDLTARRQAEEALLQAQSDLAHASRLTTLGQFTATIAHEVNQPLGAIATNGEAALRFLGRPEPDLAEVRAALDRIIQGSKRASDVVARIRSHLTKSVPEQLPVDLAEVIEEATSLVQRELQSRRVELRFDVVPGLPPVLGDRVQLQQVIINLLINGAQAMADVDGPRRLAVSAGPTDDRYVRVQVRDIGVGITEENMPRLFGTFFTTKPDGMGLGLAICRSIVEAHGGRIRAVQQSTPGALIEFTLPFADEIGS